MRLTEISRSRLVFKLIALCMTLGLLIVPALAQETTGGVQGTVKDPQGAVIPGAAVEVTSPALIGKKTATTDSGGYFHFEQLPPGIYSVSVNAPGFGPATQSNLQLTSGGVATPKITLQVGAITQKGNIFAESVAPLDANPNKNLNNGSTDVL